MNANIIEYKVRITIPHAYPDGIGNLHRSVLKWKRNRVISGAEINTVLRTFVIQKRMSYFVVTNVSLKDFIEYVKTLYRDCIIKYEERIDLSDKLHLK